MINRVYCGVIDLTINMVLISRDANVFLKDITTHLHTEYEKSYMRKTFFYDIKSSQISIVSRSLYR